ncbi:MAG: hypothetical protein QOD77_2013 [Thermoplasmata archaeon]|jgi:hypothetical protein|nr:hypothetical protein [Thermoplasmata archaeon]
MTRALLLLATALLVLAPVASAHTTVTSADGKVRMVVGLLNEPVVTYSKTGLDVCFTNNTAAREPLTVNPGDLTATLVSPGGKTLQLPLRTQFGRAGCYQFEEPFILTEPGQYVVDLVGTASGSALNAQDVKAGGSVLPQGNITFPADVPDLAVLESRVAAMQAQMQAMNQTHATKVQSMESRIKALEAKLADEDSKGAPMPTGVLVLAMVLGAAMLARRRAAP